MGGQAAQVMVESDGLKPGWQWVKLGDVVRQVKDKVDPETSGLKRYIAGEHMETDDLRIRRWGEIGANYLGPAFHMRFKPRQVLYGSRRTYLRKVAVPDFEGICANTTFVLESKNPDILLPELLPFIMQTERFHEHSVKQSKGSVNPYVNFSDLAWFEFALPPLEEQRSLVKIFRASNDYNERLQEAAKNTFEIELAWLKDTFEEHQAFTFKKSSLANLLLSSPQSGVSAPPTESETGHWVLALNALSEVGYVAGQLKPVEPTQIMVSALLKRGDLLISRSNTWDRVGFVGIYDGECEEQSHSQTL
jgi:type I restriction enzyme S subunit